VHDPEAGDRLLNGESAAAREVRRYETASILPVGAVYLFLRDRNIDTVPELAGAPRRWTTTRRRP
jgi:hypothetical protein